MGDDDPTSPGPRREPTRAELEARTCVNLALHCRHLGKALLARAAALMQGRERDELRTLIRTARETFERAELDLQRQDPAA